MVDRRAQLLSATAHLEAPLGIVDDDALVANADDLVRRAGGVPIRVATKSVRVRSVVEEVLRRPGFAGVMTYSLAESVWLADLGHDDVLLAYPSVSRASLHDLAAEEQRLAAITVMVDSTDHLDLVDAVLGAGRPTIRVCLDVDASLRLGPIHLGARRSPVHTVEEAERLARAVAERPGFALVGLMFYDAQIAGVPDSSPAVRLMKRRSAAELVDRRATVVATVGRHAELEIVNAGGTGSLHVVGGDPVLTELTAGSGLFAPTLFDGYAGFSPRPAGYYALDVVRRPAADLATLFSGGFIASGPTGASRAPTPVWPEDLALTRAEGAGEVQTPVRGAGAGALAVGDRVLLRHAKAGEMCERLAEVARVDADGTARVVPTYRGEGRVFG
ncbi:alanine racemase [Nocardioides marinus]|uniref:D-serine deaminase-like pyridoxal phosphate-dependent protein n=1 Tax=Nocardioides marinus TaxID=374514 RepID=A0A7Y9YGT9_9ACTN|nr:alanine racemase [Nocardioides marinus]NYI10802.1 D-serine deaminase-like pyridoxal phosphate-dependent protein [Nocardioides marinus]